MSQSDVIPPRFTTLILLSGLSVGSLNMFLPSLPNIAAEFETSYALVNLSIAGYAAMTAVLQLIMGPLSDRYGRRPVIMVGLAIFCLASLGCLLATDVVTFLVFRMIQSAIVSGHAVSRAVIRDCYGAQKAASLMGYMAMAWAFAPMLAPVLGGFLDEMFRWRASFWAFVGLGTAMFALCWVDLRETNRHRSKTLMAQFRSYPELLRSRRFWGYSACLATASAGYYAFLGAAPVVAIALFDISLSELGIYIGIITIGFVVGSYVSGRFSAGQRLTTMMMAGRLIACAGLGAGLLVLAAGFVHELSLFGACILYGVGNGITMPSSSAGAMSVRPNLAGSASGLSGALTVTGGAIASAITGLIVTANNAAYVMLGMMLLSAALGLVAAAYVAWVDRQEAQEQTATTV